MLVSHFRVFQKNGVKYLICLQEYEIDKKLGIKGPEDVAKMGVAAYNKECRAIVMRYASEWEVFGYSMIIFLSFCVFKFTVYI